MTDHHLSGSKAEGPRPPWQDVPLLPVRVLQSPFGRQAPPGHPHRIQHSPLAAAPKLTTLAVAHCYGFRWGLLGHWQGPWWMLDWGDTLPPGADESGSSVAADGM